MDKSQRFVITINRELGSGGRSIGEKVAQRLNVPFFHKALIQSLESEYNLTTEEIERLKGQKHNWWADFKRSMGLMPGYYTTEYINKTGGLPDFLITDDIFKSETEILKGIAEDGSCVIAGRSGFHIFRDHPNHLSILIQASLEYRIEHLISKRGISHEEAQRIIEQVDEARKSYVNKYCKTSRYDTRNYDVVIKMDGINQNDALDIIMKYIHQ